MLQLSPDVGATSKDVKGIAKETGSSISTSKQDIENLRADLNRIICSQRKLVHEDILLFAALLSLYLPTRQPLSPKLKRLRYKLVNEVVDSQTGSIKLPAVVQLDERSESQPEIQLCLRKVKRLTEELLLRPRGATKYIHRLAQQELGRAIEGELVEERLQVDGGSVSRDLGYQMLDVRFKGVQVSYLGPGEAGADECLGDC